MGSRALIVLLLASILFPGCGKKGPPRIPMRPESDALCRIICKQEQGSVVLQWQCKRTEPEPEGFVLMRGEMLPHKHTCRSCPDYFKLIYEQIPASRGSEKTWAGTFADTDVKSGHYYEYRLRLKYRNGKLSEPTRSVFILFR